MTTTSEYDVDIRPEHGWVGWIILAAIFMLIVGILNVFQGLAALLQDEAYWVSLGGSVVVFNVTTWGWIQLLFGVALIAVAILLSRGSMFGRVVAMILVASNMIAQFGWATLYPFWALTVIAINGVILYALVVHGRELKA